MVEYKIKSISHQALCFQSISDLALSFFCFESNIPIIFSVFTLLKGITCFAIVHMFYTYCARQFARAVMNEVRRVLLYFSIFPSTTPLFQGYLCFQMHCSRTIYYHSVTLELSSGFIEYREEINRRQRTRQRTYLHSTDMRCQPSYSVYRSEPVRAFGSRYAPPTHEPPSRLFVVDPPDYEMASDFARRRYDSNVRLSVKLETRQPRYNRTQKKVRFDDSRYECEIRYPTQSPSRVYEPEFRYSQYSSRGPRSQNIWDSNRADIRYETREPKVIHHGLHEMSSSGRRLLRQRGRGPSFWF